MREIHVRLNSRSVNAAIRNLAAYREWVDRKGRELALKLAEAGVQVARIKFAGAIYPGEYDVIVDVVPNGSGYSIVASGQTVAFIELGTGIRYPEGAYAAVTGTAHGTYGQGRGASPKGWFYKGEPGSGGVPSETVPGLVHTYGNPPANAMYGATQEIQSKLVEVAREVFSH